MAKMIPSAISPKVTSAAERKIYEWFKNDPLTKDWVVFHSLGIENHQTLVFGEIDFLVCASNLGVFALEVKGGRISRKDGVWVYMDKYGVEHEKVRGPFEQASEGMYSVKEQLQRRAEKRSIQNAMCGYGVMFPDIEYVNSDIDVAQQLIFDKRDGQFVGRYIKRLSEYNKAKFNDKKVLVVYPSNEDIDEIVNVLRRDFDKALPLSTKVEYSEQNLITLTDEQYRCIDGLSGNKRCLINGAAGTGKTILAIKYVKQSIAKGKKVGFFCYNRLLAQELQMHFDATDDVAKPQYVGTLTSYLEKIVQKNNLYDFSKIEDKVTFYKDVLPMLALDAIAIEGVKFDQIVLDEAQDLMTDGYLMVIDALLTNGLKKGEWFFFGDFDYQTIYNRGISNDKVVELLEDESNFAVFNLTVNCRNSANVQREMNRLFNLNGTTLNKDKNLPEVKYVTYKDQYDEAAILEAEISHLLKSGIKKEEITLLSPFRIDKSVASKLKKHTIDSVAGNGKNVTYSTIQGFKGLENSVIILTDIRTYNSPALMYVAMSRARNLLIVLETEYAKSCREKLYK